eukprot:gene16696-22837_t
MIDSGTSNESIRRLQAMIFNFCLIDNENHDTKSKTKNNMNGKMNPTIDLRRYGIDSGESITNITVQELCVIHPTITSLDLANCHLITDIGCWSIAKHCVSIQKINFSGCVNITNVGIRSLSLKCNEINTLNLSDCIELDDVSLTVIASGSWKISHLNFTNCYKITDNGISKLSKLGKSLLTLNVKGCINIGEFGDRGIKDLGSSCYNLQELIFTHAKRIEDPGLIILSNGCVNLLHLEISGCVNITKKSFKILCNSLPKLSILSINTSEKLYDKDMEYFYNCSFSSSLISLELISFKNLSDVGISIICKSLYSLNNLNLTNTLKMTDMSSHVIANLCNKLRTLDLTKCYGLTDQSIHAIASKLSALTALRLDGNNKITMKTLLHHINNHSFEFVELSTLYYGYSPKPNVETLIQQKEKLVLHTSNAIKIQSIIRRKFAHRIYWERYRTRLINVVIPYFQAIVRGRIRARRRREEVANYYIQWNASRHIQRIYRGHLGKLRFRKFYELYLENLYKTSVILIQKTFRGYKGKIIGLIKKAEKALLIKQTYYSIEIQRFLRGCIGRYYFKHYQEIVTRRQRQINSSIIIQKVFRGHK